MSGFSEHYFSHLHPNDELIAYMRGLREERGLRLALLTNNVREWEPRWRRMLPVDEIFELVVDSAYVGMRKPEREIYELTLSRLGARAEECVFVDDFPHNCDAARELGLAAVQFRSNEQAIAEIEEALGG
jgi:epoxide hydrolase-like predicted phosphatase